MEMEEDDVEFIGPPIVSGEQQDAVHSGGDHDDEFFEKEDLIDDLHRYKPKNCCERHCCGGLQGMACGWPKGTVRAIIAVIVLIIVMGVEGFLVVWLATHDRSDLAIAVGGGMLAELSAVIAYYYSSRSTAKGRDDDATHHQEVSEVEERRRQRRILQ